MILLHLSSGLLRVEFTHGEPVPEDAQASIVPSLTPAERAELALIAQHERMGLADWYERGRAEWLRAKARTA